VIKAESVRCADPQCGGRAEPEQDGDHLYFECTDCGYAFGFSRMETALQQSTGTCAVGIPEDVRRAASQPMTDALTASGPPLLSIGRRPDAPEQP
jgi:tRNA(Ile2) C34 agmatinyltransferase TiaS